MRKFTLDDTEAVFRFSSCEKTTQYTFDGGMVSTLEDARRVITDVWLAEYEKYGYARYALLLKPENKVIGFSGVKYLEAEQCADLGYRMLPEYWGKGLGLEAAQATLEYANNTLELTGVVAEAAVENIASNKILTKIGLKLLDQISQQGLLINRYRQPE